MDESSRDTSDRRSGRDRRRGSERRASRSALEREPGHRDRRTPWQRRERTRRSDDRELVLARPVTRRG